MIERVVAGLAYGLSGGLSPGATNALIVAESLRHGRAAGARVAIAPLLTDAPIIAATFALTHWLAGFEQALAWISLAGAVVLVLLAIGCWRVRADALNETELGAAGSRSALWRGMLANAINPHPWLFWLTIGAPTLGNAWRTGGLVLALAFIVPLYVALVGVKLGIALIAAGGRNRLGGRTYVVVMRLMALLLIGFAVRFVWEARMLIGIG